MLNNNELVSFLVFPHLKGWSKEEKTSILSAVKEWFPRQNDRVTHITNLSKIKIL